SSNLVCSSFSLVVACVDPTCDHVKSASLELYSFLLILRPPPTSTLFPYTTLFRSYRIPGHPELARFIVNESVRRRLALVDDEARSEEHTSELQSRSDLVCRLLLEKKN